MFATVEVKRFFDVWQALRTDGEIPHYRAVFDAMPSDLIPGMMLYEQAPEDRYIVRFMGTVLVDLWGGDLTGKDRLTSMPRKSVPSAVRNFREILGTPCGLTSTHPYGPRTGIMHELETLLLPAENDPGKPRRVVAFGQVIQPLSLTGLYESRISLHTQSWINLGFGTPRRQPDAVETS